MNADDYFPPEMDLFSKELYSRELADINEPSLYRATHGDPSIRFLYRGTRHERACIRFQLNANGIGTLNAKEFRVGNINYQNWNFAPAKIISEKLIDLDSTQTQQVLSLIEDFWQQPSDLQVVPGEAKWLIESSRAGQYHALIDITSDEISSSKIGFLLLMLARLQHVVPFKEPCKPEFKWGYVDRSGKFVVAPRFAYAQPFSEGVAWVRNYSYLNEFNLIDREGNVLFCVKANQVSDFSCGLSLINQSSGQGYVDKAGNFVIPLQRMRGESFKNGKARVALSTDGHTYTNHVIDTNGNVISEEPESEKIEGTNHLSVDHPSRSRSNNILKPRILHSSGLDRLGRPVREWLGFVDSDGQFVIPAKFSAAQRLEDARFSEDIAIVSLDGSDCYLGTDGKIIAKFPRHGCRAFHEGLAAAGALLDENENVIDFSDNSNGYQNIIEYQLAVVEALNLSLASVHLSFKIDFLIYERYDRVWNVSVSEDKPGHVLEVHERYDRVSDVTVSGEEVPAHVLEELQSALRSTQLPKLGPYLNFQGGLSFSFSNGQVCANFSQADPASVYHPQRGGMCPSIPNL